MTVGGVSTYQLREGNLTLEIPTKAAEELGLPEVRQMVVDFDLTSASIAEVRRSLTAIFVDSQGEK